MEDNKKDVELEEKVDNTEENNIEEIKEENTEVKPEVENTEVKSDEETQEETDKHEEMKAQLKAEITEELKAHISSDEKNKENGEVIETGFFGNLAISFIDLVVSTAIAFALYMITKVILKAIGYNIVDTFGIYLIVYVVTNLLYRPILKALKMHETVGEKVLNIK